MFSANLRLCAYIAYSLWTLVHAFFKHFIWRGGLVLAVPVFVSMYFQLLMHCRERCVETSRYRCVFPFALNNACPLFFMEFFHVFLDGIRVDKISASKPRYACAFRSWSHCIALYKAKRVAFRMVG